MYITNMFDGPVESASFICYFYESSAFFGHLRYDSINSTFQKEEDRILGVKAGNAPLGKSLVVGIHFEQGLKGLD